MSELSLAHHVARIPALDTMPPAGEVIRTVGLLVESAGPRASVGEVCELVHDGATTGIPVQVVGFRDRVLLSVPLGDVAGIRPGARIVARRGSASVPADDSLLGRVLDPLGRPLDGRPLRARGRYPLFPPPLNPMDREPIRVALGTGVRSIDGLLTCGRGQRVGLFGGSGVGKSTLLGMLTRGTAADVIVLGLVG